MDEEGRRVTDECMDGCVSSGQTGGCGYADS